MPPKIPITQEVNKTATTAGKNCIFRLRGLPGEHQAVVGLSGGVDSSLTAALLVEAGWEINGLTLWLMSGKGSCCTEGLIDAAGICKQLQIPHHILDSRTNFDKEIIQGLINGYQAGITPSPCSKCNRSVKFSAMVQYAAEELNINRIATGHYARLRYSNKLLTESPIRNFLDNRTQLLRGLDRNKDQSYFLYDLTQDVLNKVVFPLGELTKSETRMEAHRLGLRTAKKPESQDLCLAEHHGSMKAFLDNYLLPREGEILLREGTVLGKHDGVEHFTIGQRKGLGIAWKEPLYVVEINSTTNQVIVAPRSEAGKSSCTVGEINWVSIAPPEEKVKIEVQVRYRGNPAIAELIPLKPTQEDLEKERPHRCLLKFEEEEFSITPGQAAVFYSGDIVLGGGIIKPQST